MLGLGRLRLRSLEKPVALRFLGCADFSMPSTLLKRTWMAATRLSSTSEAAVVCAGGTLLVTGGIVVGGDAWCNG